MSRYLGGYWWIAKDGKRYLDHDPKCAIWQPIDRACTCTVHGRYPFPMLSNWNGWLTATTEEQEEMQRAYRDKIISERIRP